MYPQNQLIQTNTNETNGGRIDNAPTNPPRAMTADHSALSRLGLVDELTSRRSAHDDTAYGHIGIAFTPTGETLGQYLVLYRSQCRPTDIGEIKDGIEHTHITPCVQGHHPTFRREASSDAIAVAGSDAGEPSIPTSTGACAGSGINGSSSWMMATGTAAADHSQA